MHRRYLALKEPLVQDRRPGLEMLDLAWLF
jgi:hypothetical protein